MNSRNWAFSEQFGFNGYDRCKHEYIKLCKAAHNCKRFRKARKHNRTWNKWQRIAAKLHLKIKAMGKE